MTKLIDGDNFKNSITAFMKGSQNNRNSAHILAQIINRAWKLLFKKNMTPPQKKHEFRSHFQHVVLRLTIPRTQKHRHWI